MWYFKGTRVSQIQTSVTLAIPELLRACHNQLDAEHGPGLGQKDLERSDYLQLPPDWTKEIPVWAVRSKMDYIHMYVHAHTHQRTFSWPQCLVVARYRIARQRKLTNMIL